MGRKSQVCTQGRRAGPRAVRGVVLPLVAVALVAVLGAAALAIDLGHGYVSKTQLQNALDAAALGGAKVLDETGDSISAEAATRADFRQNALLASNATLLEQLNNGTLGLTVQFSNTLDPFVPGTTPAQFVRIRGNALRLPSWFANAVGVDHLTVSGSAVAGPSPKLDNVCNVVPIMVCGDLSSGASGYYGYTPGLVTTLKLAANDSSDVGPGNFRLIRLGTSVGANDLRQNAAGNYEQCMATSDGISTQPGNDVGPIADGLNTRLGLYQGSMRSTDWPADQVSAYPLRYTQYEASYASGQYDHPDGVAGRRILVVPFGDCTQAVTGQGTLPLLGFGCFFMTEAVGHTGHSPVTGEFIQACDARGLAGPNPATGPGPHVIQLYKDPDNVDA